MRTLLLGMAVLLAGCKAVENQPANALSANAPVAQQETAAKPMDNAARAEILLAIAQTSEDEGDVSRAIATYESCLKLDPVNAPAIALPRLAVLHDQLGQLERAEHYYQRARKQSPNNVELLTNYGYSKHLRGDVNQAAALLEQALRIDPAFKPAHANLGMVRARQNRISEALHEFALAGCSEAERRCNLGLALAVNGDLYGARQQYQIAVNTNPRLQNAQDGIRQVDNAIARLQSPQVAQATQPIPMSVPTSHVGPTAQPHPIQRVQYIQQ